MAKPEKDTKRDADYTPRGTQAEHCSICTHYMGKEVGENCSKITGHVAAAGWCKHFKLIHHA